MDGTQSGEVTWPLSANLNVRCASCQLSFMAFALITGQHVLKTLRIGRATVWGRQRRFLPSLTLELLQAHSGLWLLGVSSQMLPRFPFLSFQVK